MTACIPERFELEGHFSKQLVAEFAREQSMGGEQTKVDFSAFRDFATASLFRQQETQQSAGEKCG
jgi:hypothetical protein